MLVFRYYLQTNQRFKWDDSKKYGSIGALESSHQLVQAKNYLKKIDQIYFLVLVYVAGNSIWILNKQDEGIILSNHSPQQVESDK